MRLTMQKNSRCLRWVSRIAFLVVLLLILPLAVYWGLTIPSKGTGATWRNIIVGESTSADVIAELGTPNRITRWLLSTTYHYYPREYAVVSPEFDTPMIVIQGGVVVQIEDNTAVHDEQVHLSEFVEKYGKPDYVTWAHETVGERVVVFLDDGIVLATTVGPQPETTDVLHAYFFRPCSMLCVKLKFLAFVFGEARTKTESGEEPSTFDLEDPWGLTKDQ
jgi:hypothetical protein